MNIGGMIAVAFVCFLKLIITGIPAAALEGLTFWETFFSAWIGGSIGIIFFTYLIDSISQFFKKLFPRKKKKIIFTRRNRMIVTIKKKFGLYGIAFLTPFIFSMPLGAFIALRFYSDKVQIIRFMLVSVLFWSAIGAWLSEPIKLAIDWINEII
jgi:uncharacterized membrane protein YidH (DUF202 family)